MGQHTTLAPASDEEQAPLLTIPPAPLPSAEKEPRRFHGSWWQVCGPSCKPRDAAACLLSWQLPCVAFGWNAHRVGRNGWREAIKFFFLTVLSFAIIRGTFELVVYLRCGPDAFPMPDHHHHHHHMGLHHGMHHGHGHSEPWVMHMGARPMPYGDDALPAPHRPCNHRRGLRGELEPLIHSNPAQIADSKKTAQVEPHVMPAVVIVDTVLAVVQEDGEDMPTLQTEDDMPVPGAKKPCPYHNKQQTDGNAVIVKDPAVELPAVVAGPLVLPGPGVKIQGGPAVDVMEDVQYIDEYDQTVGFAGTEEEENDIEDAVEDQEEEEEDDDDDDDEDDEEREWLMPEPLTEEEWEQMRECAVKLGHAPCALMALMMAAALYATYYAARRRQQLREQFGIPGSFKSDFMLWACCPTCALAQETRTLMENQVEEGVWHGPAPVAPPAPLAPPTAVVVYPAPEKVASVVAP